MLTDIIQPLFAARQPRSGKLRDFLDGSVIEDPAAMELPTTDGRNIALVVNRKTLKAYDKKGPAAFTERTPLREGTDKCYLARLPADTEYSRTDGKTLYNMLCTENGRMLEPGTTT